MFVPLVDMAGPGRLANNPGVHQTSRSIYFVLIAETKRRDVAKTKRQDTPTGTLESQAANTNQRITPTHHPITPQHHIDLNTSHQVSLNPGLPHEPWSSSFFPLSRAGIRRSLGVWYG